MDGFDIDIGRRLADDLGVRVEFMRVAWSTSADEHASRLQPGRRDDRHARAWVVGTL